MIPFICSGCQKRSWAGLISWGCKRACDRFKKYKDYMTPKILDTQPTGRTLKKYVILVTFGLLWLSSMETLPPGKEKWTRAMTTIEAVTSATRRIKDLLRRSMAEGMRRIPETWFRGPYISSSVSCHNLHELQHATTAQLLVAFDFPDLQLSSLQ